jgi:argininosuccinate lyase
MEVQALTAAWQLMQTVRRLAWDLSLYTSSEFGFVRLPARLSTGSSMMPNKRNPDLVEMVRAAAATVGGCLAELQQLVALPSGYHRDLQATKAPTIRALSLSGDAITLAADLIEALEFDRARMAAAIEASLFATDRAVTRAMEGRPFRSAYREVAVALDQTEGWTVERSLAARVSPGACGNLMLDELEERLRGITPRSP